MQPGLLDAHQQHHRPPHLALLRWVDSNFGLLPESDDRLMVITNFFRNALIKKPASASGKPEIEARMGYYCCNNDLPKEEKVMGQMMLSCGYLQILPFKQEGKDMKNFFHFVPGIREDHFVFLRDLFEEAVKIPSCQVINKGHTLMLDTIYNNHTRVTKNITTNSVTESIEKIDRTDINIQNCGQDIRITSSIERTQSLVAKDARGLKVSLTRKKSRYSYDYEFMGFDLTQIKTSNDPNPTYEVEMEVRDVEYLLKYLSDPIAFNKLVLRFLSNMQSLYLSLIHICRCRRAI
eukprot:TRINITY_DN5631_c0_g1_i4.p1 TRINITY_DN5631_c0_g1~~TRINITY_DN5631_c0_g1_i4.p1  ORF type:complete len:292 (+),score=75.13 TRINITY_DN5631_c0_g1_i4:134-1009(+)